MEEIWLTTLDVYNFVNNRENYQPQLVIAGFLPTVGLPFLQHFPGCLAKKYFNDSSSPLICWAKPRQMQLQRLLDDCDLVNPTVW